MPVASQVLASIAALLHIVFFLFESVLFKDEKIQKRFFVPRDAAESVRVWAFNQGFYNLFLALGVIVGLLGVHGAVPLDISSSRMLVLFPCACMVGAGIVLAFTDKRMLRAAIVQLGFPLIAIVIALL